MDANYRVGAISALDRARAALAHEEDCNLRYAALELRMALECLVYDRAKNYKEELSNKKLSTWQPRQLLNLLLEIDPFADQTCTIKIGVESEYSVPAKETIMRGTDRVISLKEIKENYDSLGSYLHSPTLEQVMAKKCIPGAKLRQKCEKLIEIIQDVLDSPVWNVNIRNITSVKCEDCGADIIRRVPAIVDGPLEATCIDCEASYTITKKSDGKLEWKAKIHKVSCANPECCGEVNIWERDIKLQKFWRCDSCDGVNEFALGVKFLSKS
ncbi:hypothetical protein [Vogesella indigofera]|uniref:hypothetical protein n=1 Tax=Vogesella indigofera TaxID=45465 RepID=UPI00234F51BD|nr:hypothetical protein [Vogesella indigofera]MDC7696873.1 hypothetical protein [Vogesella indigofera]